MPSTKFARDKPGRNRGQLVKSFFQARVKIDAQRQDLSCCCQDFLTRFLDFLVLSSIPSQAFIFKHKITVTQNQIRSKRNQAKTTYNEQIQDNNDDRNNSMLRFNLYSCCCWLERKFERTRLFIFTSEFVDNKEFQYPKNISRRGDGGDDCRCTMSNPSGFWCVSVAATPDDREWV